MKPKLLLKILFLFSIFTILEPSFFQQNQAKAAVPTMSIAMGTDVFREYDKQSRTGDSIYLGTCYDTPFIWRVLDTDVEMSTSPVIPRGVLLLSEYTVRGGLWFTAPELSAIGISRLADLSYLSKIEAERYLGTEREDLKTKSINNAPASWWLRCDNPPYLYVYLLGDIRENHIPENYTIEHRFAPHLNPDAILFSTAAVGGKPHTIGSFSSASVTNPTEWKLTLRDSSRSCYASQKSLASVSGGTVTLNYFSSNYGSNEYLSAIITDQANRPIYYGKLKPMMTKDDTLGFIDVALPDSLTDGNYTLKLFSEQDNGDKCTDYASDPINIPLEINNTAPEIVSVTPDNGAADIPVSGVLTVTFDKAMDTKMKGSISLHTEGSTSFHPILAGGSWINGTTYTINYANLAYGTSYTIDIRNFKDATGVPILQNTNYNFTTQAMPVNPTVSNAEITITEGTIGYFSVAFGSEPHAATGASITIVNPEIASVGFSNQAVATTSGSIMVAGISCGDTIASVLFHDTAHTTATVHIRVTEPDLPHLPGPFASTIGSLTATSVTSAQAVLSWISTPDDEVICYRLCQDGRPITYFKDTLTFMVSGLSPSTTYRYLLQECNKDVGWLDGPEITVTTSPYPSGSYQAGSSSSANDSGSNSVGWTTIADEIAEHRSGNITYTLSKDTVVPVTLFHVLKGKDLAVVFSLGNGIDWIIQGKDLTAWEEPSGGDVAGPSGIDLNVALSGEINLPELKESLAKLDPALEPGSVYQLSLSHTGTFGFSASLRLPMDITDRGRTANLYYYHPDTGELELTAVSIVNENGTVTFNFSHASDYIITVDNGETCKDLINQITVAPKQKTLYIKGSTDKSFKITPKYPAVLQEAMNKDFYAKGTYRSTNPKVAVVTGSGKVIGIKPGNTKITATLTINGIKKTFTTKVTVKKAVPKQKEGKQIKK